VSSPGELAQLLLSRSVQHGDFLLASGARSSFYIDARLTTMSAQGLVLIGHLGLEAIRKSGWHPAAIGGLTLGADPVAYAIAAASTQSDTIIQAFSVRKAAKTHGTGKKIEGNFQAGDRVVIVEDVITSGGSAQQAIEAVESEGGAVEGVLAVVDREQGGRRALENAGYQVVALTTVSEMGLIAEPDITP
jgi:orotate phosphoribosyltransferase